MTEHDERYDEYGLLRDPRDHEADCECDGCEALFRPTGCGQDDCPHG